MIKLHLSDSYRIDYVDSCKDVLIKSIKLLVDGKKYKYKFKKRKRVFLANINDQAFLNKILHYLSEPYENNILTARPERLNDIKKKLEIFRSNSPILYGIILPVLFDFELFKKDKVASFNCVGEYISSKRSYTNIDSGRSRLLKELKINTCPYCNRNFTMTGKINVVRLPQGKREEKQVSPALDHYWAKSLYPYLAISLYNLIPSCNLCNSIVKHKYELNFDDHIHPHEHSFHDGVFFEIKPTGKGVVLSDPDSFTIEMKNKKSSIASRSKKSADFFGLRDLYNQHKDYVIEILAKRVAYSQAHLDGINAATGLEFNKRDVLRIFYGNYLDEKDINKRPLAKLTIDLTENKDILDIIRNS